MKYRLIAVTIISSMLMVSPIAYATETDNAGLSIAPVRKEITITAGQSRDGQLLVTNRTDEDMIVSVAIQSLSVANYSYEYRLKQLEYDWVKLGTISLSLRAHQQVPVPYTVVIPADAASGGYYFALLASTPMTVNGVKSTVRAAMPLYVTVDGGAIRYATTMENAKVPLLVTGSTFAYSYDVKNSGNVHVNGHFTMQVESLFTQPLQTSEDHAVFPGTIRTISGTVSSPLLPGIYKLSYGYTTAMSDRVIQTAYIVNVPLWFVIAVVAAIGIGSSLWRRGKNRRKTATD